MIPQDKLTRAERIRLEALNQVNVRHVGHPPPLEIALAEAAEIEAWLKLARDNA